MIKRETHGSGIFKLKDLKKIGKDVTIERGVLMFHVENILIGNYVYIGHNSILKGYHKNNLSIGDGTWIGQNCFFHSGGGIKIGKNVGIAPSVKILSSNHKKEFFGKPLLYNEIEFREVAIEDDCDLGIGSIILPGIKVGRGAIVGAGSVVTKDVLPYSIVAGNPAKIISNRI